MTKRVRQMKLETIGYWTATALIALETFAGGTVDLIRGRTNVFSGGVDDALFCLGSPTYLLAILGLCKIAAAITLVIPGLARLRNLAYAGIVLELEGAFV